MSIVSRGAGFQFAVGIILVSLFPLLVLEYVLLVLFHSDTIDRMHAWTLATSCAVVVLSGLVLLGKYPVNIVRLRRYLSALADGKVPHHVDLITGESDLAAIEAQMSRIMAQTEERIRTIETQTRALVDSERQRVMLESLGAACHHIGQPATVIMAYLDFLRQRETDPEKRNMLDTCRQAAEELAGLLLKLQRITTYQTEPYTATPISSADDNRNRILKI